MSFNRGSESWRRMSRFRRRSLVRPIEAEVLEPRCLLTDATGTLGSDTAPADAAAPLTGDVVIGPDLWDDAGLTLLRDGDLVHVVRTGTARDVIAPFAADAPGRLIIQGRDNASDVLTIDLGGVTNPIGYDKSLLLTRELRFDGGIGTETDELRLQNAPPGWSLGGFVFVNSPINDWSHFVTDAYGFQAGSNGRGLFGATYRRVELVTQPFGTYSEIFPRSSFESTDDAETLQSNVITVDQNRPDEMILVSNETLGVSIQLFANKDSVGVNGGRGNDVISILSPPPEGVRSWLYVNGGQGDDTLIGSSGKDSLDGSWGDDFIDGGAGDDVLTGDLGNDTIQGGAGRDTLTEFLQVDQRLYDGTQILNVVLKTNSMTGQGNDVLSAIEFADIQAGGRAKIDASAFSGSVSLRGSGGNDTLIGGTEADTLNGDGGADLLIGGSGDDVLIFGWNNIGQNRIDTLCGGSGNDDYQLYGTLSPLIIDDENKLDAILAQSSATKTTTAMTTATKAAPPKIIVSTSTTSDVPASEMIQNEVDLIPVQTQTALVAPPGDGLLIGQGIATDGQDEGESASLNTAGSDAESRSLADTTPDDDPGADVFGFADDAELASNTDASSAILSDEFSLGLDAALSNAFLESLGQPPLES